MTIEDIITSLKDQARDKDNLAGGDPDSIFTYDAAMLLEASELLQGHHTKLDRNRWEGCNICTKKYCFTCSFSRFSIGKPCMDCFDGSFYKEDDRNFCQNCGRPLTEEAWVELERRVFGNDG